MLPIWHIFETITGALDAPMRAAVDGHIDALFPSVIRVFEIGLTIWLAIIGYSIATGRGEENALGRMMRTFIFAAAAASAVTASTYHQYVEAVALDLPNAIATTLAGGPVTGNSFDQMLGRALTGGLVVWQQIGDGWNVSVVLLKLLTALYWLLSGVVMVAAYAVWLVSRVVLYLVLAIGPLFVPLFLFSFFRGWFDRFVGVIAGVIVLQVLIASLLSIVINAELMLLTQLSAPGGGPNVYDAVLTLLGMALVLIICWKLLQEMPGIALSLTGGHYSGTAIAAGTWVQARAAALGGGAMRAIGRQVAPTSVTTAPVRRTVHSPPGRSL